MIGKRTHEDFEPQETVHESRQAQVYGTTTKQKPPKKPRNSEASMRINKQAHATSVNAIKKRIRDVSRRLEHSEDLPANIRVEDERALAAGHQELRSAEAEKTKQKMIKRYHMVRFFERQKATRQLKRLRKELLASQSETEVKNLKNQMHVAEVDLSYTQYCPLNEPYISLYPQKKPTVNEEEDSKEPEPFSKPPLWPEVEKRMEEGTLDELRNRISSHVISKPLEIRPPKPKSKQMSASMADMSGLNRRERRGQMGIQKAGKQNNQSTGFERNAISGASESPQRNDMEEAEEESDGGFFEN